MTNSSIKSFGMFNAMFLSDLDGVLFQSKGVDPQGLYPMVENSQGDAYAFATPAQADMFSRMSFIASCVPVTIRSVEQFKMVSGWRPMHQHQLALVNNGMTLLYRDERSFDGWRVVDGWSDRYIQQAKGCGKMFADDSAALYFALIKAIPEVSKFDTRLVQVKIPGADTTPVYFTLQMRGYLEHCIKTNDRQAIARLRQVIYDTLSTLQGRYTYCERDCYFSFLPGYAGKAGAVERLLALVNGGEEEGLVDGGLDLALGTIGRPQVVFTAGADFEAVEFMGLGHFALTPTNSQLMTTLRQSAIEHLQPSIPVLV
ncbi:HAD family hydrolase [Pseudomonas aeruginosa]